MNDDEMGPQLPNVTFAERFAAAPTLDSLPDLIDPNRRVPANPPKNIQEQFVGASYLDAYLEAQRFVDHVFEHWPDDGGGDQTVLDFGSGWGRITRMLLCRMPANRIWASDVDNRMTALVNTTLPGVNAVTNSPMPPSAFRDELFDAVTSFSVFSHLSEEAHDRWAVELGRLTRIGGRVFITVLEGHFLAQVVAAQSAVAAGAADDFATHLAGVLPNATEAAERVRRGEFVYAAGGADDDGPRARSFYGWAIAPRPWIERVWGGAGFAIVSWTPTGELFDQAVIVLERRKRRRARAAVATVRRLGGRIRRRLRELRPS